MPATVDLKRFEPIERILLILCDFFCYTTIQKQHQGGGVACLRLCGTNGANYFYLFWSCQVIRTFWEEIHNIFEVNIPFKCETLYLGKILFGNWNFDNKMQLRMLLVGCKKSIMGKWFKVGTGRHRDLRHGVQICKIKLPDAL